MKKRYGNRKPKGRAKRSPYIEARISEIQHPLSLLPEDQLPEVTKQIGENTEKEHARLLGRLDELIRGCNPFQTLAHFAFCDRFLQKVQTGKAYKPVLQHSLEFFQAYFLTVPISELRVRVTPEEVLVELNEVLRGLEATFPMLGFGDAPKETLEKRKRSLLEHQIRVHTYAVRNAGYYSQVMDHLRGVFGRFDAEFQALRGVRLSALVTMCERILKLVEGRAQEQARIAFSVPRQSNPIRVVNAYCDALGLSSAIRNEMLDEVHTHQLSTEQARYMCANDAGRLLPQVFEVELSDLLAAYSEAVDPDQLLAVVTEWSLPPQGLLTANREHLFLNMPIWHKPIIQIGPSRFFWPMVELFHSFGLEMLEGLLRAEAKLWDRYQSRVRGEFLEERVDELCRKFFPGAQIFRGSKWKDQKDGRDGENDVLVLLDTVALTIECKSGRIPPDARRGHPQQLPRVVKKLIEDASKQSSRFAELLLQSNEVLSLSTKKGGINVIDASKVKRVIRLNVTLDYFGPLACAVRELVDSKLIDPAVATAPTLALVDLENVFHVLDTQLERLHYLARRADVERNISLFAWEEDLLACYLATGLNFERWKPMLQAVFIWDTWPLLFSVISKRITEASVRKNHVADSPSGGNRFLLGSNRKCFSNGLWPDSHSSM